jgi:hypothetical protein
MADAPKTRYFTSSTPVFQDGVHYAAGKVIPVAADKCNGREYSKAPGPKCDKCGRADAVGTIVQLDKPSKNFTECGPRGGPVGTTSAPAPVPVAIPEVPKTMAEVGGHSKGGFGKVK